MFWYLSRQTTHSVTLWAIQNILAHWGVICTLCNFICLLLWKTYAKSNLAVIPSTDVALGLATSLHSMLKYAIKDFGFWKRSGNKNVWESNISWKISIVSTATQQFYRAWQQKSNKIEISCPPPPTQKGSSFQPPAHGRWKRIGNPLEKYFLEKCNKVHGSQRDVNFRSTFLFPVPID